MNLGLELRVSRASVPARNREAVSRALKTLMSVHADLRELSRGMHSAVLSPLDWALPLRRWRGGRRYRPP